MKVCAQCGQSLQDYETYCPRCGSREIKNQVPQQPVNREVQRPVGVAGRTPMQGQGSRPTIARPQQMQQGQGQQAPRPQTVRPQQGQGPRPTIARPQQGVRPQAAQMQGQGQQVTRPTIARPQQMQQGSKPQMQQTQQIKQTTDKADDAFDFDDFDVDNLNNDTATQAVESAVQEQQPSKGLFGKLKKKEKVPKEPKQPKQKKEKVSKEPKQKRPPVSVPMGTETPVKSNISVDGINSPIITIKEWIIFLVLLMVPIYRYIHIFKILKGQNVNPTMKNLMFAELILIIPLVILIALLSMTVGANLVAAVTY